MCLIKDYDKFLVKLDLLQQKAINFYRKNCQSIEIVKDDELQKVNFRVKNKVLLTNVTIFKCDDWGFFLSMNSLTH